MKIEQRREQWIENLKESRDFHAKRQHVSDWLEVVEGCTEAIEVVGNAIDLDNVARLITWNAVQCDPMFGEVIRSHGSVE